MRGESEKYFGRGISGGKVSAKPFPRELYELARSRGYVSQMSLTREFGHQNNSTVSAWYRGERVPSPEYFGAILRLFRPNDEELEKIIDPYCKLISHGFGRRGVGSGAEKYFKLSRKRRKPPMNSLGLIIDKICDREQINLKEFALRMDVNPKSLTGIRRKNKISLDHLAKILEKTPNKFNLSEDEVEQLTKEVVQIIDEKTKRSARMGSLAPCHVRSLQKDLPCQTYLPIDIAFELDRSRERVRQIREKLRIENVIMTEDDRQKILDYHRVHQRKVKAS